MSFQSVELDVNQKHAKTGEYVKIGSFTVYVPLLDELASISLEKAVDDKGVEILTDDGLPVYKDDNANWLQNALFAQVKAQGRNKLVSKTATLKEGKTIATDWQGLTEEVRGGGNAEALAAIREARADFATFVGTLDKSAKASQMLNQLFGSKAALQTQPADIKGKMAVYIGQFVETLNEAQTTKYTNYLTSLAEICESTEEAEDF